MVISGLNRSLTEIDWDGKCYLKHRRTLTTVQRQCPTNRFNDGKTDVKNRVWMGMIKYDYL